MCGKVASENPFLMVHCPDKYKTQKRCDKAVDYSLPALKLTLDWFVTSKMIKKLYTALYGDENILYFDKDSGNVVFSCNEMGILNIDLYILRILILITILMKMILILLFLLDFWVGILNLENVKILKKRQVKN